MSVYWKDIETDAGRWFGLALECREDDGGHRKPALRLESGHNARIRLVQDRADGGEPVTRFWATPLSDYYGVHLLRSDAPVESPVPVSALDSAVVERHAALPQPQRLASWSRVFAQALGEGPASFLHAGPWMFIGARPLADAWKFEAGKLRPNHWHWPIKGVRDALRVDPVLFIDWCGQYPVDQVLNLRAPSPPDDGRVKWWRKKAREGALPPILLWRLDCLQAYAIVDGHDRLQAALLEDRPPDFLVACLAHEQPVARDPVSQQAMMASLERHASEVALKVPGRTAIATDSLNTTLISAFDDRPIVVPRTYAWASRRPESQWLAEVEARLAELGRSELFCEFDERY